MPTEEPPVVDRPSGTQDSAHADPYADIFITLQRLRSISDALVLHNLALRLGGQTPSLASQACERDHFKLYQEFQAQATGLITAVSTCALTGVLSYRALMARLSAEFDRAGRYNTLLAVAMLDLNHFREMNRDFGHIETNRCLAQIGVILRDSIRTSDLVGRFGGDEFVVICPCLSEPEVLDQATRLCKTVAEFPFPHSPVTISVGVASLMPSDAKPEDFLERANLALRRVKATGRGFVLPWDPSLGWPEA